MNKPGVYLQNTTFDSPLSVLDSSSVGRLVVLIPDAEAAEPGLARRIWELASPSGLRVLFLGLYTDANEEVNLRRQLVTLTAAIQDNKVSTEIRIEFGNDWIEKVKAVCLPGDILVCFAEQQAGLQHRPLSQILTSNFETSVYILSGLHPQPRDTRAGFLSQVVPWAGSIGIILAFFWIQVKLDQLPKDWAHTTLLYLSIIVEIGLIWLWNSLTT